MSLLEISTASTKGPNVSPRPQVGHMDSIQEFKKMTVVIWVTVTVVHLIFVYQDGSVSSLAVEQPSKLVKVQDHIM